MNGQVTVSVKGLLVTGLVLLALVTAYLLGAAGGGTPPAQAQSDEPTAAVTEPGTLRMLGTGEVSVVPDQLSFALSVTDKQADLDQALANSSTTMKRVLAALRAHGRRILFTGAAYFLPKLPVTKLWGLIPMVNPLDQFMELAYHIFIMATQSTNVELTRPLQYGTALVLLALTFTLNLSAILLRIRFRRKLRSA